MVTFESVANTTHVKFVFMTYLLVPLFFKNENKYYKILFKRIKGIYATTHSYVTLLDPVAE
jgi:hypothetical protein